MGGPRGLTLIELLLVCAVIGVVLVIVMPGLRVYRSTMALQQARLQLISDVRIAREVALARHRSVIVEFGDGVSTSNLTTYSILTDLNNNAQADPGEPFSSRTLPSGVSMSSALHPTDRLKFNARGLLAAGNSKGRLVLQVEHCPPETLNVSRVGMIYER